MAVAITLQEYLDDRHVDYDVVTHPHTESAIETAAASHIAGERIAKAVLLKGDDGYLLAVLPASHRIQLHGLEDWLQQNLALATEAEIGELFGDCDLGAVPAIGAAYGVNVIFDDSLTSQPDVYFEGGDHASLVRVTSERFERLMGDARRARFGVAEAAI